MNVQHVGTLFFPHLIQLLINPEHFSVIEFDSSARIRPGQENE